MRKFFGLKLIPEIEETKIDNRSYTFDLMMKHLIENMSEEELKQIVSETECDILLNK